MINLHELGFKPEGGGAHLSRTIMVQELSMLFEFLSLPEARTHEYKDAIINQNCLGKRSGNTRKLTFGHLKDLYALDPDVPVFKAMRFFWARDEKSRPMLALLCAIARDPILRHIAPKIINIRLEEEVPRETVEQFISEAFPNRFSSATLKSTAQNINSSLSKAGLLKGRVRKFRKKPELSIGVTAYATCLARMEGNQGLSLFDNVYTNALNHPREMLIEQAELASAKGWMVFKHVGNVMEVDFPKLIDANLRKRMYG